MAGNQRTVERWITEAVEAGWRCKRGGKHWRLYPADKAQAPMTVPASPGDYRSVKNTRAEFRRRGLEVEL